MVVERPSGFCKTDESRKKILLLKSTSMAKKNRWLVVEL